MLRLRPRRPYPSFRTRGRLRSGAIHLHVPRVDLVQFTLDDGRGARPPRTLKDRLHDALRAARGRGGGTLQEFARELDVMPSSLTKPMVWLEMERRAFRCGVRRNPETQMICTVWSDVPPEAKQQSLELWT